jgi:hypothetical protein
VLLVLGQVLPFVTLGLLILGLLFFVLVGGMFGLDFHIGQPGVFWIWLGLTVSTALCALLPRALGTGRFRQDWRGALLHPVGVLLLLVVQWYALWRKVRGGAVSWRDRTYAGE